MPLTSSRRTAREVSRSDILEVAVATIRTHGPGVSMDDIAAAAGVSKPVLYRRLGSKRGLYEGITDWFISELLQEIVLAVGEHRPLRDVIASVVETVIDKIDQDRNVYQFLQGRARMDLSSSGAFSPRNYVRQFGATVAALINERLEQLGLDPGLGDVWAHAVVGMINNTADWWVDHPEVDKDVIVDALAGLLWEGFAPVAEQAARLRSRPSP